MCVRIIGEERKASVCEFVYTCKKGMKEGGKEGKKKKGRERKGGARKEGRTEGTKEGSLVTQINICTFFFVLCKCSIFPPELFLSITSFDTSASLDIHDNI